MNKVAFLCSGQGSQYIGMGEKLYNEYPEAKEIFDTANEVLGFSLTDLCFKGDLEELTLTKNVQPALLAYSYALYKVYSKKFDLTPSCLAGHSLGEYTALLISGAIKYEDALKIVRKRGELMQEASCDDGCMAAVMGFDNDKLKELCEECSTEENTVSISNYNSSVQTVISGSKKAVDKVVEQLKDTNVKVKFLTVSAPFHSRYMQPAADKLREELEKYTFSDLKIPVITNFTAKPYKSKDDIIYNLTNQLVSPVQWVETMNYIKTLNINTYIELGPKRTLTSIAKREVKFAEAFSLDSEDTFDALLKHLEWKFGDPTVISRCMAVAVCTRNSNWNEEEYEKGVSVPYKKVEAIQNILDETQEYPTKEQMLEALNMLKSVFKTKGTPVDEQKARFQQIFNETRTNDVFKDFEI